MADGQTGKRANGQTGRWADGLIALPVCPLAPPPISLQVVSRAFVNEDAGQWGNPARRFNLPDRDDPGFDRAAAQAMLDAAREGDTGSAEMATGYYWGEEKLKPYVREILERVRNENDERMVQLAERFLR